MDNLTRKKENQTRTFISGKIHIFDTGNWTLETGPGRGSA